MICDIAYLKIDINFGSSFAQIYSFVSGTANSQKIQIFLGIHIVNQQVDAIAISVAKTIQLVWCLVTTQIKSVCHLIY